MPSGKSPVRHDGDASTYAPLDTLKEVAGDVWIADSGPLYGVLPVRMTAIRLPDGAMLLHSPTRFAETLRREIEAIGPIRALVAPNLVHWMFLRAWQVACPEARTWAVPGLRRRRQVRRAGLVVDHDLSDGAPGAWGGAIEVTMVPGGFGFSEAALFHRPSRTLVLTDLVLNIEARRLPLPLRPLAHLVGMTAPTGRAPVYLRALVRLGGSRAAAAAGRLIAMAPERVIFAHGRIFAHDAAGQLRRSLGWLAPSHRPLGR